MNQIPRHTPPVKPVLAFICSPYREENHFYLHQNIEHAEYIAESVAQAGWIPIIPHTMLHRFYNSPTLPESRVLPGLIELMLRCDVVVVNDHISTTAGMDDEINAAKEHGKPIILWSSLSERLNTTDRDGRIPLPLPVVSDEPSGFYAEGDAKPTINLDEVVKWCKTSADLADTCPTCPAWRRQRCSVKDLNGEFPYNKRWNRAEVEARLRKEGRL